MEYRTERDSLGEVKVPADRLWGAQTQRSKENFTIGVERERMPEEIVYALALIKRCAAAVNARLLPQKMTSEKKEAITRAAREIEEGKRDAEFPLVAFQTGSGTQTNMNVNEVIANLGNAFVKKSLLHPNDDVNMSQSSNDVFPSALHIAAVHACKNRLAPPLNDLIGAFLKLEKENEGVLKCGRTHLQDATPILFSQEISGWRTSLEKDRDLINSAVETLLPLALGGTAVGTGLNAPKDFGKLMAEAIAEDTGIAFTGAENKFHALTSRDETVFLHGALKALAADLMKIANDIRFLGSGPRTGYGEISIPANEPGSSIMPGKVNPTQCEAVTQVAVQVMGNDSAIGFAASQGNFELNVFLPVIALNLLQSIRLLADCMESFCVNCVRGIVANREKMAENVSRTLMTVTALSPVIGYENAAKTAKRALETGASLKDACAALGYLTPEEFDKVFHPEKMV